MEYWVKLRKEKGEYHTITTMSLVCFSLILLLQASQKIVEIPSVRHWKLGWLKQQSKARLLCTSTKYAL